LKKYTWISEYARKLSEKKGIPLDKIPFEEETRICDDMKALLPSKIFRMRTQGEKGLAL